MYQTCKAHIKKWLPWVQSVKKRNTETRQAPSKKALNAKKEETQSYFIKASSWADDIYTASLTRANRYQKAFFASMALNAVLGLAVMVLAPMQQVELEVVHQGPSHNTWVSLVSPHEKINVNWQRTRSEIAHYVQIRESYDPVLYTHLTKEVEQLSAPRVYTQYEYSQSKKNSLAGINLLGAKGYRSVVVNDVILLDQASKNLNPHGHHVNLAQVNFVTVDHFFDDSRAIKTAYVALVSWRYEGIPQSPDLRMYDWDGFTITKYSPQPVNFDKS